MTKARPCEHHLRRAAGDEEVRQTPGDAPQPRLIAAVVAELHGNPGAARGRLRGDLGEK